MIEIKVNGEFINNLLKTMTFNIFTSKWLLINLLKTV